MIELYKYISFKEDESLEYRKQLIADRSIYFNDAKNFNDPLDCNIAAWEEAKAHLKPARFFCMARINRDDKLMFAHYGDEHRGVRLKFEVKVDEAISDCGVLALGREVIYKDKIPGFDRTQAHYYYYIKSKSWEYEQEYRISAVENPSLSYSKRELKEVALGARFNMDLLPKLKNWLQIGGHESVDIVRAIPSKNISDFDYDYVPLNA